ncbi:MAG: maltose alpha-D-glucosyltransferase [bacterium]|nr:maltose alpha-D-glucosyltransferase [bacterium]
MPSTSRRPAPRKRPAPSAADPLWYKDAVIYELRVGAFQDSDADGIGDFRGLTTRLDYLRDLGVTALWLLPFYPSPLRDDGYDIADYTSVHPDFGTLEDFKIFLREAHRRGLRVVTELVINHTSDQHAWFQRARHAPPGSAHRDFYVWSDTPERWQDARVIFKDFEPSNWTWDPVAKAYYWHRFYAHQPDLNFDSPAVRRAVLVALDFWLDLGVDGMRLDAIPYLVEREGTNCENLPETHAVLRDLRRHVDRKYGGRMLLAEANQWPEDAVAYFGAGDECHMCFHFPVMPRLFMSLHMEDRFPIIDILQQTPAIPDTCQWALFLRNHDELTLEMVTDEERDYMYRVYAFDARARINLGIRRRLAPLLGNDRKRMELMNALLFSLPGTPVLYYGDEIGMGDNIYLGDRNGVRTPMQWSADRNAGFSRANPQKLHLPIIIDPAYHYESVNVEAQQENLHSLLLWMRRLIGLRRRHQAFSRGTIEFLQPSNPRVLVLLRQFEGETILVVANLSRFVQYVELDLAKYAGAVPIELFGQHAFPRIGELPYLLTLGPHAFYWFGLVPDTRPAAVAAPGGPPRPAIHVSGDWTALLRGEERPALEAALAMVLPSQRWYGAKSSGVKAVALVDAIPVPNGDVGTWIVVARVTPVQGDPALYALPLVFATGDRAAKLRHDRPARVLVDLEVDAGGERSAGVCVDAADDPAVDRLLLDLIARRRKLQGQVGRLVGSTTRQFGALRGDPATLPPPTALGAEQSNTSVRFGDRLMLKLFRRLSDGSNPELEVGRYLTEQARFPNVAPLAGAIEYRRPKGEPITLAVVQGWVPNEGDLWKSTLDQVEHFLETALLRAEAAEAVPVPAAGTVALADEDPPALVMELLGAYLEVARALGFRLAALHQALGRRTDDPAFAPEPYGLLYQRSLYQSLRNLVGQVFRKLGDRLATLPPAAAEAAGRLLATDGKVLEICRGIVGRGLGGQRIRCHGDLHLGQVLRSGTDFVFIDFEGEPARPLGERRLKRSPLRDVAGMLRSFDYAVHGALDSLRTRGILKPGDVPRLERWGAFWSRWVSSAFLRAYLHDMGASPLLPRTRDDRRLLLDVLTMEKVVYELGYELDNRPGWVGIPLRGVLDLLDQAG